MDAQACRNALPNPMTAPKVGRARRSRSPSNSAAAVTHQAATLWIAARLRPKTALNEVKIAGLQLGLDDPVQGDRVIGVESDTVFP
jgi:hypothetical protein